MLSCQLHTPVFENFGHLLEGAWVTVYLSVLAVIIGLVVSLAGAIAKIAGPRPLRWLVDGYIEMIERPFLAQIYFIYFALPELGLRMAPNVAALVALVVNVGAFATEIVRAGIDLQVRASLRPARRSA